MNVLFVAPRYHTNQTEIVRTLVERGHRVEFHAVLHGATEDHSLLVPTTFPESRISATLRRWFGDGGVNRKRYFPPPLVYWRAVRTFGPDVVIVRLHGVVFSTMAAMFARLAGARVVLYAQKNTRFLVNPRLWDRIRYGVPMRLLQAEWMTPLLDPSQSADDLPPRFNYVPFAVRVRTDPPAARPSDRVRFLMIGKFVARKNHLLLLDAIAALRRRDFTVTLVGEASDEGHRTVLQAVEARIDELGVRDVVRVRPNVAYEEIPDIYRAHDVFVLPARNEPASISVLEAMGQGLPVICTDSCGTRTYVRHGETGFIVDSDDVTALANALTGYLGHPERAQRMGRAAWIQAREQFDGAAYYRHFLDMLERV